jgi:hypothetical protein
MFAGARKIGAQLEVWSRPGLGTEVEVRVPAAIAYRSIANESRWQWLRRIATGGGCRRRTTLGGPDRNRWDASRR